jgi:hypothetical protein
LHGKLLVSANDTGATYRFRDEINMRSDDRQVMMGDVVEIFHRPAVVTLNFW